MDQDFGAITQQIPKLDLAVAPPVLLVDDDELVLLRLKEFLEAAGFEVSTATDGGAALTALQDNFAPIVILDRKMPGMDGLTLCRTIRQRTWPGYVYILLLTVQDGELDILAGLDAGADDYLSKRSSSAQLLARLRTARRILTLEHSLKAALEEKRQLSVTDALTGVPNRRYFLRHAGQELKRAKETGYGLALMSLDLDHFKTVNDQYGHGIGDVVLQEFVLRMTQCLRRDMDWCARLGGEEFVVVLPGASLTEAGQVAERIRQAISSTPVHTTSGPVPITVSIGVTVLQTVPRESEVTIDSILQQCDQCLYASKQNGRNLVTLSPRFTGR